MRVIQTSLLVLLVASLLMVGILCLGDHSPLSMTGGTRFVVEAAIPLGIYSLAVLTAPRLVPSRRVYRAGFVFGLISGALQIIHMSLEVSGQHVGERAGVTLMFMMGSFALWCVVAVRIRLSGGSKSDAIAAAVLSAITTMVVAVTFGIFLAVTGYPDPRYVSTWPEFIQSGWSDVRAFAIADTFEAAASHLIVAPIIGVLVGGLGLLIALILQKTRIFVTNDTDA